MQVSDRSWLDTALNAWPDVRRRYLKAADGPWSTLVVYDGSCRYTLAATDQRLTVVQAMTYSGGVPLSGGVRLAPGPHAQFNELSNGERMVLMALPSVWQTARVPKTVPLEWMLEGVLFHELTHAFQSSAAPGSPFVALQRRGVPLKALSDDTVQNLYAANPSYAGLVSYERLLLGGILTAQDPAEARERACEAAAAMRDRRRRLMAGNPALPLADIDEAANTSEGLGNWVAFRWLTEQRGVAPATAATVLGGSSWSQSVGLALFRALDRVSPGWEPRLLSDPPVTGIELLAEACS